MPYDVTRFREERRHQRLKRLFPKSANMVPDEIGRLWSSRSRRDRGYTRAYLREPQGEG